MNLQCHGASSKVFLNFLSHTSEPIHSVQPKFLHNLNDSDPSISIEGSYLCASSEFEGKGYDKFYVPGLP